MSAAGAPRIKRQFAGAASHPAQRQITSFFSPSAADDTQYQLTSQQQEQQSAGVPDLPANVQTNLALMGMRIRKSVAEGYKTGTYSSFALWDEKNAKADDISHPSYSSFSSSTTPTTNMMVDGQRTRANAISEGSRELLPFCAIHDIGGLAPQPDPWGGGAPPRSYVPNARNTQSSTVPTAHIYQPINQDMSIFNDLPGLTSSQESVESNASSFPFTPDHSLPRSRKRSFIDEEEEPRSQANSQDPSSNMMNSWLMGNNNSPKGLTPAAWQPNNPRPMAIPRKSRRKGSAVMRMSGSLGSEQENVMVVDSDFEEAEFLDRKAWEMEM
ncbi:ribonucleotide reductase inhibitor-domain-containing protein [Xylariaceae sp. FL0255]|nr:ribonucleotide reductase inhibitor-domain-containing protein [Xylariaceae sp. FL0255]